MKCDEGYICDVCGSDVASILDSDLYLRYLLGEIELENLHLHQERHIRCNPAVAQYIVHTAFAPCTMTGPFAKDNFDAEFVAKETARITHAWLALQKIPQSGKAIPEYRDLLLEVNPGEKL
ncbi:MAG: hypothetical protein R3B84_04885 [Zavarzinella sp.]